MATNKNIQMSEFNGVDYDILLPQTRLDFELGNEYVWAKISEQIQNEYDEGTTTSLIEFAGITGRTVTFVYGDTYSVNDDGIHTTINQPNEITVNSNSPVSIFDGMKGKWWSYKDYSNANKCVCYMPESATVIRDMSSGYANYKTDEPMTYRCGFHNVTTEKIIGYVNSPSPDTYPPTIDDGYIYKPLGQLGDKVRIATGSYIGTGTYGSSNPNSLTFDFEVYFLAVSHQTDQDSSFYAIKGAHTFATDFLKNNYHIYVKWNKNDIVWESSYNELAQLNEKRKSYYYIGIGC